jgi:hypothetical protein
MTSLLDITYSMKQLIINEHTVCPPAPKKPPNKPRYGDVVNARRLNPRMLVFSSVENDEAPQAA